MITFIKKDITTVTHGIVAHGVNCQCAMGSGVAGAIRRKWPTVYTEYSSYCATLITPEEALGIVQTVQVEDEVVVANCFTQLNYGNDGKRYASLEALTEALISVFDYAEYTNLPVYLPKIGCGLGGLSWENEVYPLIKRIINTHDIHPHEPVYDIKLFICEI